MGLMGVWLHSVSRDQCCPSFDHWDTAKQTNNESALRTDHQLACIYNSIHAEHRSEYKQYDIASLLHILKWKKNGLMSDVLPKKVVSDVKRRIALHSIVLLLWSHSTAVILNIASFQINFNTFIFSCCPDTQPVLSHAKPMWWHREISIKTDMSRVSPCSASCERRGYSDLCAHRTAAGTQPDGRRNVCGGWSLLNRCLSWQFFKMYYLLRDIYVIAWLHIALSYM